MSTQNCLESAQFFFKIVFEHEAYKTGIFFNFWQNLTKILKILYICIAISAHNFAQNVIKLNSDRTKKFTFRRSAFRVPDIIHIYNVLFTVQIYNVICMVHISGAWYCPHPPQPAHPLTKPPSQQYLPGSPIWWATPLRSTANNQTNSLKNWKITWNEEKAKTKNCML